MLVGRKPAYFRACDRPISQSTLVITIANAYLRMQSGIARGGLGMLRSHRFGDCWPLPALVLASPAAAQGATPSPIDIRPQPLSVRRLRELARQTGQRIALTTATWSAACRRPGSRARLTVEATLRQLLAGTDLTVRRASSGAWVIERRPPCAAVPGRAGPERPRRIDRPTPEILVTAKRSQNADIQRRESDVQPYQVTTQEEIVQRTSRQSRSVLPRAGDGQHADNRPRSLARHGRDEFARSTCADWDRGDDDPRSTGGACPASRTNRPASASRTSTQFRSTRSNGSKR